MGDGTSYKELGGRRATLAGQSAGTADDSGGDSAQLSHSQTELGGRLRQGRRTTLAGTADDSGGDSARLWRSQKKLGGRTTLGEVDDSCGDRQRLWRPSLAGGNLAAGDPWRGGWRATPAGTADDSGGRRRDVPRRAWRATLAGMAGESGRETTLAGLIGGRIWWGLRTSLALASSSLADGTVDESQSP